VNSKTKIVACQTTLRTLKGAEDEQAGIPQSEHFLDVVNGTSGLTNLGINVNGKHFDGGHPALQTIDIGSALHEGNTNAITGTRKGKPGGTAWVLVQD
jgi:hypothetical protein